MILAMLFLNQFGWRVWIFMCALPALVFLVLSPVSKNDLYNYFYRPQRSCGKVMFLTCLSFCSQGGVCPGEVGRHPPRNACWDTVNKRAVRILLECILVGLFL